jgi:hypothetical protein
VIANLVAQLFDLVLRRRSLGHGHPLKNIHVIQHRIIYNGVSRHAQLACGTSTTQDGP